MAWGIRFPAEAERWTSAEPPLPATAHAFVVLEFDEGVSPTPHMLTGRQGIPAGWSKTGEGSVVAACPLHEFGSAAPDGMTDAWAEWVTARCDEIKPLLKSLTSRQA